MLEEIYDRVENLTEDDYYDALLFIAGDAYPDLSEEEIEEMLEEVIDQMPEQYAEGVLRSIKNLGKDIGSGTLRFASENPELIKMGASVAGGAVGGPIGANIGNRIGNYAAGSISKQNLPETEKALAAIQNSQAQAALTRPALGIGNGTTQFVKNNGKMNLVPVATVIRGLILQLQKALVELDTYGQIPPAVLSEALPFAQDVDMQAEWIIEELVNY
jgi:hypothetical protein